MKEKIYHSLKQTFSKKYGVSDDIFRGCAESLAATGLVTNENLATAARGQEAVLRACQKSFDQLRRKALDARKELDELKAAEKEGTTATTCDAEPIWFKQYRELQARRIAAVEAALMGFSLIDEFESVMARKKEPDQSACDAGEIRKKMLMLLLRT